MSSRLLDFVDDLPLEPRHITLFYERPLLGRMVLFRFVKNGLVRGETVIYTTHGDTKNLRHGMEEFGIDVEEFQQRDLLHLIRIEDPLENSEGFDQGLEEISEALSAVAKPPYRLVSRFVRDVHSSASRTANLEIEKRFHAAYEGAREGEMFSWAREGSTICEYLVEEIGSRVYTEWRQLNTAKHHAAMLAVESGQSMGYFVGSP